MLREGRVEDRLITFDVEMKQFEGQTIENKEQQEIVGVRNELEEIRDRATRVIHYNTTDNDFKFSLIEEKS